MKKTLNLIASLLLMLAGIILMIPNFIEGKFEISAIGAFMLVLGIFLFGLYFNYR